MFIDMDRFKVINDTVGHHIGDELLIEVGRRLHDCVRDSDIVARLGGDEFIVVLTGLNSALSAGAKVADKIVESLSRPFLIKEHELHSSPSIGISIFPNDGGTADELMKTADTAMYHAKELGRNNYQFFTEAMNQATNDRLRFENDLRKALGTRQFELYYQPQIEALSGGVIGVEALIRWRHPVHGFVAPTKLIPVAEEIGLIKELGAWVLEEGLRAFAEWRDMGFESLRIAVNFSACQLQDADIVADVERLLAKFRLPRGSLELEITESVAMENPEQAICVLSGLRDLGVALAIDDFGTGYSSLAYIKQLPIQTLKLDRAFVRDIETDANDAAISSATLALAHNMGLKVVAEGVETEGQRAFLLDHRCDVFQGFLFSKPLSRTQIEDYLAARRKGS